MTAKAIPLSVPNFKGRELEYVTQAVSSEWVSTAGSFITDFEREMASYVGAKHAVACQSGTAGLHISLILFGVGAGDEVIAPTLTFIAPINAIHYVGASPVFLDCDEDLNLDVAKVAEFCETQCERTSAGLRNRKTGRLVKAILPVHIFGNAVDLAALRKVAERFGLPIIEDATESLGTRFTAGELAGRFTGTVGATGVFSFNGNKIITTGGGGMLVTNDETLAKRAKYLTTQAKDDEVAYVHHAVGYNYRMTNLQAALGLAQLEQLEGFIAIKERNFGIYRELLSRPEMGLSLLGFRSDTRPNYWFYSLRVEREKFGMDRTELMKRLSERKIQSRPIWYLNHLQKPYAHCQSFGIERAPRFWEEILNIPCSTNLDAADARFVAECILECWKVKS